VRCIYLAHAVTNAASGYEDMRVAIRTAVPDAKCIEPEGRLLPEIIAETAFDGIKACDVLVADISEYSIGVGVEIGYAFGLGKQIVLIAKETAKDEISPFLRGIAPDILFYSSVGDLSRQLARALRRDNFP